MNKMLLSSIIMTLAACTGAIGEKTKTVGHLSEIGNQQNSSLELKKRIDDYIAPLAKTSDFSGIIHIYRNEEQPIVLHYGYADWPQTLPHDSSTRYSAASITKSITAATLISLHRNETLSLDDPVGKWFPAFAEYQSITLHSILQHRAGLPRDLPDDYDPSKDSVISWLSTHIEEIRPAGEERYSNVGYALLAEVIAEAANKSFPEVAQELVLKPAGMADSIILLDTADKLLDGALPYTAGPEPDGVMRPVPAPLEIGSSGLITTSADLARWARALADGAYPELFVGDDPLGSIDTGSDENGDYVSLQGTLPGYAANAIAWRDRKLTISYTGNLFSYPALNLASVLRSLVGDSPLETPSPRLPGGEITSAHRALEGRYQHLNFGTIEISYDNEKHGMFLTMPGKPAYWSFYLTPIARGELHWRSFGHIIRRDGTGLQATIQRLGQQDHIIQLPIDDTKTVTSK